jgi:hypothetical protein
MNCLNSSPNRGAKRTVLVLVLCVYKTLEMEKLGGGSDRYTKKRRTAETGLALVFLKTVCSL